MAALFGSMLYFTTYSKKPKPKKSFSSCRFVGFYFPFFSYWDIFFPKLSFCRDFCSSSALGGLKLYLFFMSRPYVSGLPACLKLNNITSFIDC